MNLNHERRGVFEQPQGGGEQTGPWGSTAPSHGLRGQDDPGRAEQGGIPRHDPVEGPGRRDALAQWSRV